jgi:hypothetical protein
MRVTPSNGAEKWFGTIADARRICGVSRSGIYRLAAVHPDLLRKLGRSTVVDLVLLRSILASLPQAAIQGSR